jgi:hypothetical protein
MMAPSGLAALRASIMIEPAEILRGRKRNEETERRGRLAERPLPVGGEANRASHWLKVLQCIEFWRDPPQSHATSP